MNKDIENFCERLNRINFSSREITTIYNRIKKILDKNEVKINK